MTNFRQGTELPTIHVCDTDPTVFPGIPGGTPNILLLRTDNNSLYYYAGPLDTDWKLLGAGSSLRTIGGTFNADGTPQSSRDCSVTHDGSGQYTCTFNPPFPSNASVAAVLADDPDGIIFGIYVLNINANGFQVRIYGNTDGFVFEDWPWSFVATETSNPIV